MLLYIKMYTNSKKEFLSYCPERIATFERQIKTNEDAPPLAYYDHAHNRTILGVADGMGGAGMIRVVQDTIDSTPRTMAYIASRKIVAAVLKSFVDVPSSDHLIPLTNAIVTTIKQLPLDYQLHSGSTFPEIASEFSQHGLDLLRYPTTLATATIQKGPNQGTIVHAMWGGDSPISILTPTSFFTTYNGPNSRNNHAIHADISDNYQLNRTSFYIPANVPFMVAACTDGLTNFNRFPKNNLMPTVNRLELFRKFWTAIVNGTDHTTLSNSLDMCIAPYLDVEHCYANDLPYFYPDDRTVSMYLSQKFVPIDEISTHLVGNGDNLYIT